MLRTARCQSETVLHECPPRPARCRIRRTTRRHRRRGRSRDDGVYGLYDAGGCRIGASASRLPSRHGGTEPISTPRKRPSGVRTLTKRGPAAFPAPSSQVPSASTCLGPASSFCGRSFQTRKTSFRSSSRAAEPPGARVALYGSELGAYCVLSSFSYKRDWIRILFAKSPLERSGIDYRFSKFWSAIERRESRWKSLEYSSSPVLRSSCSRYSATNHRPPRCQCRMIVLWTCSQAVVSKIITPAGASN